MISNSDPALKDLSKNIHLVEFIITNKTLGKYLIVILSGEISINASQYLKEKIGETIKNQDKNVALDLSRVSLLSSMGLSAIIKLNEIAKNKGYKLKIICPFGHIRDIFSLSATDKVLDIVSDEKELK